MKKLLGLFGALGLMTSSGVYVVSCNADPVNNDSGNDTVTPSLKDLFKDHLKLSGDDYTVDTSAETLLAVINTISLGIITGVDGEVKASDFNFTVDDNFDVSTKQITVVAHKDAKEEFSDEGMSITDYVEQFDGQKVTFTYDFSTNVADAIVLDNTSQSVTAGKTVIVNIANVADLIDIILSEGTDTNAATATLSEDKSTITISGLNPTNVGDPVKFTVNAKNKAAESLPEVTISVDVISPVNQNN